MAKLSNRFTVAVAPQCAALILASMVICQEPQAAAVEFANFSLSNANQPLSFTNGAVFGTLSESSTPVTFNYTVQSGLPTVSHAASLTISSTTFTPASALGAGFLDQRFSNLSTLSIIDNGTGKNLLTVDFTGDLVGLQGSPNASLAGADTAGQIVGFTSDFGTFGISGNSFNLGLATISPSFGIGAGGFLNSFVANLDGQFSANFTAYIPIPKSIWLMSTGLCLLGLVEMRRRKAA